MISPFKSSGKVKVFGIKSFPPTSVQQHPFIYPVAQNGGDGQTEVPQHFRLIDTTLRGSEKQNTRRNGAGASHLLASIDTIERLKRSGVLSLSCRFNVSYVKTGL